MSEAGNVATLPGVTIDDGAPRENIIEALEELLEEARAGQIIAFGIAFVKPHHCVSSVVATSGLPTRHSLVAAVTYLLNRVKVE